MTHLECARCGQTHSADRAANRCTTCAGPLLVRYDLAAAQRSWDRDSLRDRPASLWRYREVLPLRDDRHRVSLGEGMTPLLPLPRMGAILGLHDLWLKDEGLLPTGTFKARGAAMGISRAAELGLRAVAMPTNGNAGAAWAAYGARAGLAVALCMPVDAPAAAVSAAAAAGARVWLVRGLISDAGAMISRAAERYGWFDAATLREPYRVEGKKTIGYEIAEQGDWQLPGAILCPTGGGVGIIGVYKALQEMTALGWIRRPWPRLVAVQPAGCAPIVRAFAAGRAESEFWANAHTIQQGTRVPKAVGDFLVLQAVRATGGTAVAVTDADALAGWQSLAQQEGISVCPEGAALVAAAGQLRADGFLGQDERVVLLNTGSGSKYPDLLPLALPVLDAGAEIGAAPAGGREEAGYGEC